MSKVFVSGIGTDVGKTIVSAILTEALKADYWKPVQTGSDDIRDTEVVRALVSNNRSRFIPETYSFKAPLSPHIASVKENEEIELSKIKMPLSESIVVEGAGGLLVPINQNETYIDLIKTMDIPLVLVIRHYLGSINHSLLSLEAIKRHKIKFKGIVFNGQDNWDNENIILKMSGAPVIGKVNEEKTWSPRVIKNYANKFKENLLEWKI